MSVGARGRTLVAEVGCELKGVQRARAPSSGRTRGWDGRRETVGAFGKSSSAQGWAGDGRHCRPCSAPEDVPVHLIERQCAADGCQRDGIGLSHVAQGPRPILVPSIVVHVHLVLRHEQIFLQRRDSPIMGELFFSIV